MDTKPWYQSKTIIAGIATALTACAMLAKTFFGVDIADQVPIVGASLTGLLTLVGSLIVIYGRFTAKAVIAPDPPPRIGGPLMTLVAVGLCGAIAFGAGPCASLPANATAQQKAQHAIDTATSGAKFVVSPAITAWLLLQKDPAKQHQDAAFIYAGATALNSAATGEIMTQVELQALIATFTKADPRYLEIAQLLSSEYGTLYPLFKIAGTSPVKFFTEVALLAQNSARPFLAPQTAMQIQIEQMERAIAFALFWYDVGRELYPKSGIRNPNS